MTQEIGIVDSLRGKINYDEFPIGKQLFMFPYHVRVSVMFHHSLYIDFAISDDIKFAIHALTAELLHGLQL